MGSARWTRWLPQLLQLLQLLQMAPKGVGVSEEASGSAIVGRDRSNLPECFTLSEHYSYDMFGEWLQLDTPDTEQDTQGLSTIRTNTNLPCTRLPACVAEYQLRCLAAYPLGCRRPAKGGIGTATAMPTQRRGQPLLLHEETCRHTYLYLQLTRAAALPATAVPPSAAGPCGVVAAVGRSQPCLCRRLHLQPHGDPTALPAGALRRASICRVSPKR